MTTKKKPQDDRFRVRNLEESVEGLVQVNGALQRRTEILEAELRNVSGVLEAERAALLARVDQIDVLLALGGRTRSRGASPSF